MRAAPLGLLVLLAAPPALAAERLGVVAVHDPAAIDPDLAELTHQVRAACAERVGGVVGAPETRARLAGKTGGATLAELDRAFGGALAVFQNGEFESAVRTLRAIVEDLEQLPESQAVYDQWTRATMRLGHSAATVGWNEEARAVQLKLLRTDSGFQLDPVQYAPGFRARFEELRREVRAMPKRRLTVVARGRPGTIYVGGRDVGSTPATIILPAGAYRVGGAAGALRVPSFNVDLTSEDRTVTLDFALAEAVRPNAGPGLALAPADRASAIIRAGAWLGVDKLLVASRGTEGEAQFLVGTIYDVRRGSLLREGSVRMVEGGVPAVNVAALAAFLLTGQSSREVLDRTRADVAASRPPRPPAATAAGLVAGDGMTAAAPVAQPPAAPAASPANAPQAAGPGAGSKAPAAPAAAATATVASARGAAPPAASPTALPAAAPAKHGSSPPAPNLSPPAPTPLETHLAAPGPEPARWMRPAAWTSGALAVGLAALAVQQGLAAQGAYADADAMVGPGGALLPGADPGAYRDSVARGDAATRNAWVAGAGAVASAAGAAVLGWLSRSPGP